MMKEEAGNPRFPIWLLADSEPGPSRDRLDDPLDKRHPIRHNIWTSVLDVIQADVFLDLGERVDADQMYVRNAVQDPATRPSEPLNPTPLWPSGAQAALAKFHGLLSEQRPKIVITFGWFAFAFGLRAVEEAHPGRGGGTQSAVLGNEFRNRVNAFDIRRANVLPLLHGSIAYRHFLAGHNEFCGRKGGNCFEEAGKAIASVLIRHHDHLDCWVKRPAV
jgi:hypothetical protein